MDNGRTATNQREPLTSRSTTSQEFTPNRTKLLKEAIGWVYTAQHMAPPSGPALEIEVRVWGYSLEDIPDKHLPACFRRAFKRKVDDFMLKASAVTREWVDMKEELVALETVNRDHILMLPAPKGEAMLHSEWRERHKAKYPDGCDLRYCVECYRPLREAGAWPEGPHWLQGAVPPPAHEDVSEFGKRRRELVEQVDTVDEDEDEDDLDF